jgi:uncharacterized surface protein with fasciclin (FAS1) repeats
VEARAEPLGAAGGDRNALVRQNLVETLKGAGPFTVFAPTDEAFAKLPAGTFEALLKPENKPERQHILTSHVVVGKVIAAEVFKISSATGIAATNGVIHVIDGVIMPKGE